LFSAVDLSVADLSVVDLLSGVDLAVWFCGMFPPLLLSFDIEGDAAELFPPGTPSKSIDSTSSI
jgi:hypothetical protein